MAITERQRKQIFAMCREKGISEESRHELLTTLFGKSSLTALTKRQATQLILHLQNPNRQPARRRRVTTPGVVELASAAQLQLIASLASQRPRMQTAEALQTFCKRTCGAETPRTSKQAEKCIEGLKKMNQREGLWAS